MSSRRRFCREARLVASRNPWAADQRQYQGESIYSDGDGTRAANSDTYFYPHGQVDASIIANVTPLISVQLQGLNLNNEIFGFFQGAPSATYSIQRETYGRSFILGVKYGFRR